MTLKTAVNAADAKFVFVKPSANSRRPLVSLGVLLGTVFRVGKAPLSPRFSSFGVVRAMPLLAIGGLYLIWVALPPSAVSCLGFFRVTLVPVFCVSVQAGFAFAFISRGKAHVCVKLGNRLTCITLLAEHFSYLDYIWLVCYLQ